MTHKQLSLLLAVLMSIAANVAFAEDVEIDGIYYSLVSKTKQATVISRSNGYSGSVTIPESVTYEGKTYRVTSIGNGAFEGCSGLTSVVIPNSVTDIGNYAFKFCTSLTSITIPNSVTSIGSEAFFSCNGLTAITIPNSVTSIGYMVFYGCSGLTSVTIPNSVTSIGGYAFYGCSGLTSVTIPNSVTSIGNQAFRDCSGLKSVTIPNSVTSIGSSAFSQCSGLKSISIPNSVTSIGSGAFSGCRRLITITIGSGIQSIGTLAFEVCSDLEEVYCHAVNVPSTQSDAFDGSLVEYATLYVPEESLDAYKTTIPWSNFGTKLAMGSTPVGPDMDVELTDGGAFTNDTQYDTETITYTRNFTNTDWQALYVPFEMQYEDWKDDFEVARINNVNQYDDDEDGNVDRTVLEVFKVKSGQTEAHTPYLIKAKTTGEKTISLTDATLYKAEEKSYDVSSWNTLYTFTGTYTGVSGATMFGEGYYALGGGSLHQAADATNSLSPMRWYMAVTDRDGNPKNVGEVKVMVFGMEEDELIETGLEEVGRDAISTNEQPVFDLNGRRVTNPRKGLYIKNGKKLVIK